MYSGCGPMRLRLLSALWGDMGRTAINSSRSVAIWSCAVALTGAVVASLAGCGSIPRAQVWYYQAKTKVTVRVTRSVICDAKNLPLVANTVTPSVTHSADTARSRSTSLAGLRGTFTDSDIKFEFYEDGRLKTVNATMTGQGEAVLKAATTLASTLTAFAAGTPVPTYPDECAFVKEMGGGKPLTLTYEGDVDPSKQDPQNIPPDAASAAFADRLKNAVGGICVVAKGAEVPVQPVEYKPNDGDVLIAARQPALLKIEVGTPIPGNGCTDSLWQGRVPVAQLGKDYALPIPRAVAFGKETFSAAFAESGALTSLQYVSNSGSAGALGAANSLATIVQGETTAAKVTEVKAEADLIVQQQRLLQCHADPKNCK